MKICSMFLLSQKVFEPELDVIDNTGGVITVIVTVDDTGVVVTNNLNWPQIRGIQFALLVV